MALFKFNRGNSNTLPQERTDGYCYITSDDNKFYYDHPDAEGNIVRDTLVVETANRLGTSVQLGNASFDGSASVTLDQMGAAAKSIRRVVNLTVEGWEDNAQTLTVENAPADSIVLVNATPLSLDEYTRCGIYCRDQAENSLTWVYTIPPTVDIEVYVIILG